MLHERRRQDGAKADKGVGVGQDEERGKKGGGGKGRSRWGCCVTVTVVCGEKCMRLETQTTGEVKDWLEAAHRRGPNWRQLGDQRPSGAGAPRLARGLLRGALFG